MKLSMLAEAIDFKKLKQRKIPLTAEERKTAMDAGAVWHRGPNGSPTCAVWKSKKANGEVVYVCNTHRLFQTAPTLKGAIEKYHSVVKDSA